MLKKTARAIKNNVLHREAIKYVEYSQKLAIDEKLIFLESTQGDAFNGHIFAIAEELCQNKAYQEYKVVVSLRDKKRYEPLIKKYGLTQITYVTFMSNEYMKYLATAKYIINDTTFWDFFNKRPEQSYYIIWHGTPLKKMGNETDTPLDVSNVQRNFYMADRLYFSNEYTKEIMTRAYGLTGIYGGKIIVGPSPRNSLLFSEEPKKSSEELIFYMPTWRGTLGSQTDEITRMADDLTYLSSHLKENQKLIVKFHPFQMKSLNPADFPSITFYEDSWELYDFLKEVDVLITDYSSIMFDFANTKKKILLYTYDKEEYFSTRGVYRNLEEFPFAEASTIEALTELVVDSNGSQDYQAFLEEFCPFDQISGTEKIVSHMLSEKIDSSEITEYNIRNDKETVFLMVGGLWDNGITTALLNMFANIDADKRNYVLFFYKKLMKPEHLRKLALFPDSVQFYPISGIPQGNSLDKALRIMYLRREDLDKAWMKKRMKKMYHREYKRLFGDLAIDWLISYTGFEREIAQLLISDLPCQTGTMMHTDMYKEYELKKNFSMKIMEDVYQTVDQIIPVNGEIAEDIIKHFPDRKKHVTVVNNFLNVDTIRELAKMDLSESLENVLVDYPVNDREEVEEAEVIKQQLEENLKNHKLTNFIHIGRYAKEKSQDRLIKAFEENYQQNPNIRLILVAPHGPMKKEVLAQIEASTAKEGIIVLGRMDNPYPLLKAANCFVLSSLYEGLGLVLYESLALGTDIITVDIPATVEKLSPTNGLIVPNSQEGLTKGITSYLAEKHTFDSFDFEGSDQQSNREWESVFEK